MFETVAPETFVRRNRLILYESLPVSILVHGLAIAGVLIAAIWNVNFPDQSPRTVRAYSLVTIPDPPPPPPPPAAPKKVEVVQQLAPAKIEQIVAPTIIPDTIPVVTNELPKPVEMISAVPTGVEGGVEGGVPGGSLGGVQGGELGGTHGGVIGGVKVKEEPPKDMIVVQRDAPLPLFPISQVYPKYPENARLKSWEDSLVVRYVIGKDGRVKSVIVLTPPQRPVFEEAAVKAIRNWRFRPMVKDGQTMEVQHELTIYFRLEQGG
jgi:periplasmic protein TonB